MIKRIVSGIICCFFTITAGICLGQTDREKIYDPLEYLYARHEDDRLVKLACAKALNGKPNGAFYLGAVLSDQNSLYYKPITGLMWLIVAKKAGYQIAEDFFNLSLSRFSQKEIDSSRKLAKECVGSDYVKCFASNEMPSQGSLLGWPSQAKFKCIK